MHQWMLRYGAILPKQPDIVIADLDGRGSFTLVDIKTLDPAGPTFIARHGTAQHRLAAHALVSRRSARDYFGPDATPPARLRLRLVTFAISTFGSLGPEAEALLGLVARLSGSSVPRSLADEFSWSASSFVRFARQAVVLALRRSLAASLRDFSPPGDPSVDCMVVPDSDPPQDPDSMFDAPAVPSAHVRVGPVGPSHSRSPLSDSMSSASAVPPTHLCVGPMPPPDTGSSLGHSAVSADVSAASSTGPAYGDAALPHSSDSSVSHGASCVSCERVRSSVAVPSASFCPAAGSSGSSPGPVRVRECARGVTE